MKSDIEETNNITLTFSQINTRNKLKQLLQLYGLDLEWLPDIAAYGVLNEEKVRIQTIHLRDLTAAYKGLYTAHKGDSNLTCRYKKYQYTSNNPTSQWFAYHECYKIIRTQDDDGEGLNKNGIKVLVPGKQIRFPKIRELYAGKFDVD